MKTIRELRDRVAEIDEAYIMLMKERQNLVSDGRPENVMRIENIDAEIILIRNEKGDCIEAIHSMR